MNLFKIKVKNFYNIVEIPNDNFIELVTEGNGYLNEGAYIIYRAEKILHFVQNEESLKVGSKVHMAEIDIDKILYYRSEGTLTHEQRISGGGGGGVNYGGAVVGGLLFGGAGAIIGSRHNQGAKEIRTENITHDTRCVVLTLRTDDNQYQIKFKLSASDTFDWLIPEKQYDYVIQKQREKYLK